MKVNRVTVSFLVIGLIVGFLVGYISHRASEQNDDALSGQKQFVDDSSVLPQRNDTVSNDVTSVTPSNITNNTSDYKVEAENQKAGSVAVVKTFNTSKRSWIAIADDRDGDIGYVLGAYRLSAGQYQNVEIDLVKPMQAGAKYHVIVYEDNGDNSFNYKTDTLVLDSNGKVLQSEFTAVDAGI